MEESITFASVAAKNTSASPAKRTEPTLTESSKNHFNVTSLISQGTGLTSAFNVRSAGTESYAEAVKTSHSVRLDGVPVNPEKRKTRGQLTVSRLDSFTNSTLHEQESVLSSWADDDQCFFDSIRISTEELTKAKERESLKESAPREENGGASGCGFRKGRGGRGWRTITGGENNANNNRRRKNHNNSNRGNNYSTGNNYRRGSGAEQTNLSGGRFDVLADVSIRRHL